MREMDLIMGTFADSCVNDLSEQDLDLYDQLLEIPDPDLYNWVSGGEDVPEEQMTPVMSMLLEHHVASNLIKSNAKAH